MNNIYKINMQSINILQSCEKIEKLTSDLTNKQKLEMIKMLNYHQHEIGKIIKSLK